MNDNIILDVVKSGSIVVPLYLYKIKDKLNLNSDEFLFFIYLYNRGNKILFDPNVISNDLGIDLITVMQYISVLTDKDIISVDVLPNDKNVREEYISLENFYNKLQIIIKEKVVSKEEPEDEQVEILKYMEEQFGRTLSSIEVEVVKAWIADNNNCELVKEAVKEAVLSGVSNIRYIDKILYEWNKKGIKNKEDVLEEKKKFRTRNEKEKIEVFDYDWLNDDED